MLFDLWRVLYKLSLLNVWIYLALFMRGSNWKSLYVHHYLFNVCFYILIVLSSILMELDWLNFVNCFVHTMKVKLCNKGQKFKNDALCKYVFTALIGSDEKVNNTPLIFTTSND